MCPFDTLMETAVSDYLAHFETLPTWIVAAPGRVNLIGEHTDYNGGFVFPMAIERFTIIAAGPRSLDPKTPQTALIRSQSVKKTREFRLSGTIFPTQKVDWSSYVQGTIACGLEKGLHPEPFNALITSNVPLGGGLSSSASLEVAVATLLEEMTGQTIDPVEKALLCQKAEHLFAHMPCGIMDQFISAMAVKDHAMLLDCRSQKGTQVPMDDPDIVVLITNSNVKHALTGSEYPERRASCAEVAKILGVPLLRDATPALLESAKAKLFAMENGERIYRRARHFLTEEERTQTFATALTAKDWKTVGETMFAGHASLRDDFEVSCPEIDTLVEIAHSIGLNGGVYGSRITGGGFGGCTVTLVAKNQVETVSERIKLDYRAATGIEPSLFVTRPAQGAMVLRAENREK